MLIYAVVDDYQSEVELFTIYEFAHEYFDGLLYETYFDGQYVNPEAKIQLYKFESEDLDDYISNNSNGNVISNSNMSIQDALWEIQNWADLVKADVFVYDEDMTETMKEDYLEEGINFEEKVYSNEVYYYNDYYKQYDEERLNNGR